MDNGPARIGWMFDGQFFEFDAELTKKVWALLYPVDNAENNVGVSDDDEKQWTGPVMEDDQLIDDEVIDGVQLLNEALADDDNFVVSDSYDHEKDELYEPVDEEVVSDDYDDGDKTPIRHDTASPSSSMKNDSSSNVFKVQCVGSDTEDDETKDDHKHDADDQKNGDKTTKGLHFFI